MKRRWPNAFLILTGVVILGLVLAWVFSLLRDPVYQGKPLALHDETDRAKRL
jgi:hypothetical protein